jgi:hypothetical protein
MGDGSNGCAAAETGFGAGRVGTGDPYPGGGDTTGAGIWPTVGAGAGGRPDVGTTGAGGITGRGWGLDIGRTGGGPLGDPPTCGADRMVGPEMDESLRIVGPDRDPSGAPPGRDDEWSDSGAFGAGGTIVPGRGGAERTVGAPDDGWPGPAPGLPAPAPALPAPGIPAPELPTPGPPAPVGRPAGAGGRCAGRTAGAGDDCEFGCAEAGCDGEPARPEPDGSEPD